jgi:hypothetical protein
VANKRLTFEINEHLHSQLKAEAAEKGVSLGSYCTSILEGRGGASHSSFLNDLDRTTLSLISLGELRDAVTQLVREKPQDWEKKSRMVNNEILRRYRT